MKTINVEKKEVIFHKGDVAKTMYLIKSGKVGVYDNYGTNTEVEIAVLNAGKFFGEMGIVEDLPRSADIVALTNAELVEIGENDFSEFVKNNTADVITILNNMSKRLRDTTKDYNDAMETVSQYVDTYSSNGNKKRSLLENIAIARKQFIANLTNNIAPAKDEYKAGEIIFREGDKGNYMFLLLDGEVTFYNNYEKNYQTELATVSKGAIFGEMAVIEEEYRSATAVAKTDIKVTSVVNVKLRSFLESHPDEAVKIMRNISSKLRATTKKYIDLLADIAAYEKEERENNRNTGFFDTYVDQYNSLLASNSMDPVLYYSNMRFFM